MSLIARNTTLIVNGRTGEPFEILGRQDVAGLRANGWGVVEYVPAEQFREVVENRERLQRVIDGAYEAAMEFSDDPQQALVYVVEQLEVAVNRDSSPWLTKSP